jgi:hypothetical protein
MTTSQKVRVRRTLVSGKTLTTAQARARGISRLAARVFDLRSEGVNVRTTLVTTRSGSRIAKYSL